MGTPEPQGRTLQKAGRSGGGLVSHVYSVRWNLCLRATAADTLSAAFATNGAQVRTPPLALSRVLLSYPVFQSRPDTFEDLTVRC